MRKIFTSIAIIAVSLLGFSAIAGAAGTTSGTSLAATATIQATGVSPVTSGASTSVTSVYGLATSTFDETGAADKSASAGGFATYTMVIQNNGNTSDSIGINVGTQTFSAGSGTSTNWGVAVDDAAAYTVGLNWQVSGNATATQGGDQATHVAAIGPGSYATFTVRVRAAYDATNGATMAVQVSLVTANTPVGTYTGYNSNPYGGNASVLRTAGTGLGASYITTTVNAAILSLAKAAVVTAPAGYISNGGGATDPVPGARIDYTITYGNTGSATATTVVIVDPIPTNTTYVTSSIQLNAVGNTDASDGDECDYNFSNASSVTCNIASLGNGVVGQTVDYSVTID